MQDSIAVVFGIGTSAKNINLVGSVALFFNSEDKSFTLKKSRKGNTLKQLLEDFILPFELPENAKPSIIFRSQKIASFFKRNNADLLPEDFKIRSLDAVDTFNWELNNLYAVLIEAIGCGFLKLEGTKTEQEIIERAIGDPHDVLTQALIVGTAQPPKIYTY